MIRLPFALPVRLSRDERGMAVTEFGLIAIPFMILLLGAFDLGYQNYLRVQIQGVLNDVARTASVQNPGLSTPGASVEERIAAAIEERVDLVAREADFTIEQSNFYEFSGVGRSEKLVTDVDGDGEYDAEEDCWEDLDGDGQFDENAGRTGRGGADDVVFYEVTVTMPRLLPMASLIGLDEDYAIVARTAVRNQPYNDQAVPTVECPA